MSDFVKIKNYDGKKGILESENTLFDVIRYTRKSYLLPSRAEDLNGTLYRVFDWDGQSKEVRAIEIRNKNLLEKLIRKKSIK